MSIARRIPRRSLFPFTYAMALRACFFLLSIEAVLSQQPSGIGSILDDANAQVVFTPRECNQGRLPSRNQPDLGCNGGWLITSDQNSPDSGTWHATQSSTSRVSLEFQGTGVSWFSAPLSQAGGTADVYVNDIRIARVQLSPNNSGSKTPAWSKTDLDPSGLHNLTIVPLGDDVVTVDFFTLISSRDVSSHSPSPSPAPPLAASSEPDSGGAVAKDASSGTVISLASVGSVALVVVICGGCFFLGKRQKSPGFHMPTVLVDIESALDQPDPPSPTSIRAWRESARKSIPSAAVHPGHFQYPPILASNSRPPSYWSGKDSLYRSESSHSHEGHWQ